VSRTIAARRWSPWWPGPVLGPAALAEVLLLGWFGDRAEVGHWVTHLLVAATLARPRTVSGRGTAPIAGRIEQGDNQLPTGHVASADHIGRYTQGVSDGTAGSSLVWGRRTGVWSS